MKLIETLDSYLYGERFNFAIWRSLTKITKLKTAKLKFTGVHNTIVVVATTETPN